MRIALGSDHAGRTLRNAVREHLAGASHALADMGTDSSASVDYPKFAYKVARLVAAGQADLGILVCGTGIGMSMVANRIRGVRAAVCHNEYTGRASRAHNHANVLCLGERVIGIGTALSIVDAFIETPFEGGRHQRRVAQIETPEE